MTRASSRLGVSGSLFRIHASAADGQPGKQCTTAVRAFLRYLIAAGKCAAGLDACIPAPSHTGAFRPCRGFCNPRKSSESLPHAAPPWEAGLRDRAILLLLARVGLRAGDISCGLRLSDLDWKNGNPSRVVGERAAARPCC